MIPAWMVESSEKQHIRRQRQLGSLIEARRKALGMSRQELADKLGTTRMSVWRIEKGVTRLPAGELPTWSQVLRTKASRLLP